MTRCQVWAPECGVFQSVMPNLSVLGTVSGTYDTAVMGSDLGKCTFNTGDSQAIRKCGEVQHGVGLLGHGNGSATMQPGVC